MAPKGKQATKGQKQILEENKSTLSFYQYMIMGTSGGAALLRYLLLGFTTTDLVCFIIAAGLSVCGLQFMKYMARPTYSETGQLLDGGLDINIESGIGEHVKDIVILMSGVQLAALTSAYFWWFLLLVPLRAFHLLWRNILSPWLFQPGAPEEAVEEKEKEKKVKRKIKRIS